jgi:tetratricopeptide (TPR) repeat protein
LNFSNPHWLSSNPERNREATVAQAMDEALKTIDVELAGEPEIQGEILFTLTQSYTSQGDFKKGENVAKRAMASFDQALGTDNPRSKQVGVILADLYYLTGRFDEAETLYLSAIEDFRPKVGTNPSYLKWLAIALNDLSNVRMMKGDFQNADALVNESAGLAGQIIGRDRYCLPVVLGNQATMKQARNDYQGAIEAALNAIAESTSMGNADSFETGNLYLIIAKSMTMLGNYSEAEKQYAKADSIFMNTVGIANVYSLVNRYHTANNLFRSGRVGDARKGVEETIEEQRRSLTEDHFTLSYSQRLLGEIMTASGQLKDGEKQIRSALERLQKKLTEPNHEIGLVKLALAENLIAQDRKDEARGLLDSALDSFLKTRGDQNYYTDRCRELMKKLT